jgi:hypothetical protein
MDAHRSLHDGRALSGAVTTMQGYSVGQSFILRRGAQPVILQ